MPKAEGWTEKLAGDANRICQNCKKVVTFGHFCRKPLKSGGFSCYHYCPDCNASAGKDPVPHRLIKASGIDVNALPVVVNKSAGLDTITSHKEVSRAPVITAQMIAEEAIRLSKMPYREYLQTTHWKDVRDRALAHAERRCQMCNSEHHLQVHHRTYERRGAERPIDVIVLCRRCHAHFHGKEE